MLTNVEMNIETEAFIMQQYINLMKEKYLPKNFILLYLKKYI